MLSSCGMARFQTKTCALWEPRLQQTECPLTNRLSYPGSNKCFNWTTHPSTILDNPSFNHSGQPILQPFWTTHPSTILDNQAFNHSGQPSLQPFWTTKPSNHLTPAPELEVISNRKKLSSYDVIRINIHIYIHIHSAPQVETFSVSKTFTRTPVRVSKMNAFARAQITFQILTSLQNTYTHTYT